MADLLDSLTDVFNEFAKNYEALQLACVCAELSIITEVVYKIMDANQQEIDDRETLSEMRALVYGEGW